VRLAKGTTVNLDVLGSAVVGRELGSGGQGYVYEVTRGPRSLALKWYKPESATAEQREALQMLVEHGPPHERFLWPLGMASARDGPGFGYVMPLRDRRFVEMGHLVSGRMPDGSLLDASFSAVITLCAQLSDCFLRLHSRGLCYRDISFGNVFFDPSNGDVLICDNDNVGVDNGEARVLGTPFFMAPEIVRDRTYMTTPNTQTDLHSLAVLLFYALFINHPLEGSRTDRGLRSEEWLVEHFGMDPLFIFDPDDDSNRPTAQHVPRYWDIYPEFVRERFVRAFTEGLADPWHRVTEGEWINTMARLRDSMVQCDNCQQTNFWEPSGQVCSRCLQALPAPCMLCIGRHRVAVSPFARVRGEHIRNSPQRSAELGRVRRHPSDQARWGLQNRSEFAWTATLANGRVYEIAPRATVEILPGMRIDMQPGMVHVEGPAGPEGDSQGGPVRVSATDSPSV
jgi:eukaryotic-like serine/threonine-protein kinase